VADLKKIDVARFIVGMMNQPVNFEPGPLTLCAQRLALKIVGHEEDMDLPEWVLQHYAAAEEQRGSSLRCQALQYIHRVLWLRFTALGVADLVLQLRLWSQAIVTAISLSQDKEPSVAVKALCLVRVAQYLAEHPGLARPEAVQVQLVEVPKPGQPGLMGGGVPQIMVKKLLLHGMYDLDGTAAEVSARQH